LGKSVKPLNEEARRRASTFLGKINALKQRRSQTEKVQNQIEKEYFKNKNLELSDETVSSEISSPSKTISSKKTTLGGETVIQTKLDNTLNYTLDDLLKLLYEEEGSDLHITTGLPPVIRKHGRLIKTKLPPLSKIQVEYLLKNILKSEQQKKLEEKMTLDFSYTLPQVARFRVNLFYQRSGMAGVFRIIPNRIPDLKTLNLPPVISSLTRINRGLILVTGPTGSGKSTTLASMLDIINRERSEHIITIEDPIEFVHEHKKCIVNQREIGESATTFADALRSALREDPDIILVGEMRDLETISMAITAAETGHLVFATLHTSSAPKTIDRIIDAYPPHQQEQIRVMIAESLRAVISQTLIPTMDGRGRVCACEILINNPAVSNLIREKRTHEIDTVIETGMESGMIDLNHSLLELVRKGEITVENARQYSLNPKGLERLL